MPFDHTKIEPKWQKYWDENKTFKTDCYDDSKPKYYCMDMFPYPSGNGLHVGHPEGYTATDIVSRMKRMQGYNVLHPMGFDSFGLPAEQFAIQTGHHPAEFTKKNIDVFRKQIKSLGFSYDWDREIATSDPEYYKWTQWIFTKLYDQGLAYIDEIPVNWCPELKAVLANEEVIDGKSERGGYPVIRKPMRQWVLKITEYAERLLADLDDLDWPEATKQMQRNWIGKSIGANVDFKIDGTNKVFTVFTTRCDTLFGATYCVMAPEHPYVEEITTDAQKADVEAYKESCASKSDLERTELNKDKTGIFTGAYAINPVNGKKIPIWISDYVLASYGTGAIMAVPAHDDRDYEFAKKFGIEIIPVLEGGNIEEAAYTEDGVHINSEWLNGLGKQEAIDKMVDWLQEHHCGEKKVSYKLRDWLFSRQRYWGEPIPIVHMEDGTMRTVPVEELPLELPATKNFQPHDSGESPLANCEDWLEVEIDGQKGRRETNTMPQWAGSCWYYIRYIDPHNSEQICDPKLLDKWLPVDLYVGGAEHAVLHLLYSRFWHKFLYDEGVVPCPEPYQKRTSHGMILGENGEKMSKSRGNVVNPDDIVREYGADTLRTYEMFIGAFDLSASWSEDGVKGCRRFLERIWKLQDIMTNEEGYSSDLETKMHQTIKKVSSDYENLKYNTAIAAMMALLNDFTKKGSITKGEYKTLLILLNPVAPHITEELWQIIGGSGYVYEQTWPEYEEAKTVENTVEIAVQINGKTKGTLAIGRDDAKEDVIAKAKESIADKLTGNIVKEIYVPGRIVNIVMK